MLSVIVDFTFEAKLKYKGDCIESTLILGLLVLVVEFNRLVKEKSHVTYDVMRRVRCWKKPI